jgi:hypothetical protein
MKEESQNDSAKCDHTNSRNYGFTLLREEAVEADSFEDICELTFNWKRGSVVL